MGQKHREMKAVLFALVISLCIGFTVTSLYYVE